MSLVEQALKKAKQAGQHPPAAAVASHAEAADEATATTSPELSSAPPAAVEVLEPSPEITATVHPLQLVTLDRDGLRAAGYLPPPDQEREIAEQFRHIKRPLMSRAFGRGQERVQDAGRIAVTSPLQGEGKTFTCLNLALSLALEQDARVLLIDADVARATLGRALGVHGKPGLMDALSDPNLDPRSLLLHTDVENLAVMSAGTHVETAHELLTSPRMESFLRRLVGTDPNAIVLFDVAPLLMTNESKAVCEAVGQVVLVVRANQTPQQAVLDAAAQIAEGKYVGVVLNEAEVTAGVGYGYYGNMYQYSYRYGGNQRASR